MVFFIVDTSNKYTETSISRFDGFYMKNSCGSTEQPSAGCAEENILGFNMNIFGGIKVEASDRIDQENPGHKSDRLHMDNSDMLKVETLARLDANIPDRFQLKTYDRLKFEFSEVLDVRSPYQSNRERPTDLSQKKLCGSDKETSEGFSIDLNREKFGGSHRATSNKFNIEFIRDSIVRSYIENDDEFNMDTSDETVQEILDCTQQEYTLS